MSRRKRVLFVAEDVTLAQVVRLYVLARSLDPARYEVHFACARFDPLIFGDAGFVRHPIFTLDRARVLRAAEHGQRLYGVDVLARYVQEELALFRALRPDVVVSDLRFSLCISAPHAGIPHAALINAYWSREAERSAFPVPDHPLVSLLGERFVERYFLRALPSVLARFAAPVNSLRKRYGLAPLGDLIDVLMHADLVLFPDVPWLTPLREARAQQVFLGPVLWSPTSPLPSWWQETARGPRPLYVTLGSSGRVDRLPQVVAGLARLGRPLLVATAGRATLEHAPFTADFLPGDEAAQRSEFVVCNGGSSTAYQALAQGRPVLGIASNLDQFLAMTALQDRGAGILLRASAATPDAVEQAARALLASDTHRAAARRAQRELSAYHAAARFEAALARLLGMREQREVSPRP